MKSFAWDTWRVKIIIKMKLKRKLIFVRRMLLWNPRLAIGFRYGSLFDTYLCFPESLPLSPPRWKLSLKPLSSHYGILRSLSTVWVFIIIYEIPGVVVVKGNIRDNWGVSLVRSMVGWPQGSNIGRFALLEKIVGKRFLDLNNTALADETIST